MWYDYKNIFYEDENYTKAVEIMNESDNYELHENCQIIGDSVFHGQEFDDFEIPASVKTIEIEAFQNCSRLRSLKFNEGLKKIEVNAFANCYGLGPFLSIPNSVEKMEKGAFAFCSSIKKIELGDNLKELCTGVFECCSDVEEIDFNKIERIYAQAITDANFEVLKLPTSLKEIDFFAFDNCKIEKIVYEGSQGMFLKIKGGKEFFKGYSKIMEFETPTLEKLLDGGLSLKDANRIIKEEDVFKEQTGR